MRSRLPLLALLLLAGSAIAAPQRIVSLNLCTDLMLLELVDPARIAALTYLVRDPQLSPRAGQARDLPVHHGRVEEILPLRPDLIVAGRFGSRQTVQLLERLGHPVERFEPVTRLGEYAVQLRRLAALLGTTARAERRLRQLETALAALEPTPGTRYPGAVVYRANGFSTGAGTLVDELLGRVGLINLTAELGLDQNGQLSLEQLLLSDPELLVMGEFDPAQPALAQQLLRHPALAALLARPGPHGARHSVTIPARDWNCAGTHLVQPLAALAAARRRLLEEDWR